MEKRIRFGIAKSSIRRKLHPHPIANPWRLLQYGLVRIGSHMGTYLWNSWTAFTVLVISLIVIPTIHSQELTPEQKQGVQQIVNLQLNLDAGKVNSPGKSLEVREVGKKKSGDISMVGYHLYASGFTGGGFQLLTIPIGPKPDPVSMGEQLVLANDGEVMDRPDDPRAIWLPDFLPGEPARLGLVSADNKQRAFVTAVPNPIYGTDGACRVDVVRLLPKFEVAYVRGTGFPPNIEIGFEGNSVGEIHTGNLKTDNEGRAATAILPAVKDKPEGDIQVKFSAPQCKPAVRFHWGSRSQ
jgi:hypothetical protein